MHKYKIILIAGIATWFFSSGIVIAKNIEVGITPTEDSFTVKHNGKDIKIMRNQDPRATVIPAYSKTSRKCPPFCIQPVVIAPGVETIAELELIEYAKRMSDGDDSIVIVDSRTPDWVAKGTIPSARNIPWTSLNTDKGADTISILKIMRKEFGAKRVTGRWNFSNAKTAVVFCNGMWCAQSQNNVSNLLKIGYPVDKIKWYRGGMQDWANLGLTTVSLDGEWICCGKAPVQK